MSTQSKIWFITGASQGFGRVTTERVLAAGNVAIAAMRNPSGAGTVFSELQTKYKDRLLIVKLDTTKLAEVEAAFQKAQEVYGRIDVVFNNAGISAIGEFEAHDLDHARLIMETNFWGAVYVSRAAIKFFREVNTPQGGYLIQNSSASGRMAFPGVGFYCASKFALEAASESLSKELDPAWNIKMTIVEPGLFRTNMQSQYATVYRHPAYEDNPDLPSSQLCSMLGNMTADQIKNDPDKLVNILFKVADMKEPPLRVLVGKDAWAGYEQSEEAAVVEREKFEIKSWSDDLEFAN